MHTLLRLIYRKGTCAISKLIHFVKETYKGDLGYRCHPLPAHLQHITTKFNYRQLDCKTLIANKHIIPVFQDSKFELTNELLFVGKVEEGQHFGEVGGFVMCPNEEDASERLYGLNPEREFMSYLRW